MLSFAFFRFFFVIFLSSLTYLSNISIAQDFPNRPIRIVVPSPPGGGLDMLARYVAQRMGDDYKIAFVVENRVGAGTIAGTEYVAKSLADGYTLMLGGVSNMALNPALFRKLPYDAAKDFVPIGFLATFPTVLIGPADFPANTFAEFVSHVRSNPGKYNFASAGVGTGQHVWGAILLKQLGLDMTIVHYKGAAPAHLDLIASRTHGMLDNLSAVRQHIQAGKLKAFAVSTRNRATQLPNVPSIIETGVVDFEAGSWMGLYAPSATPVSIIERLRDLVDHTVRTPEFIARIESTGGMTMNIPGNRQNQFQAQELTRWEQLIKQTGIQLD